MSPHPQCTESLWCWSDMYFPHNASAYSDVWYLHNHKNRQVMCPRFSLSLSLALYTHFHAHSYTSTHTALEHECMTEWGRVEHPLRSISISGSPQHTHMAQKLKEQIRERKTEQWASRKEKTGGRKGVAIFTAGLVELWFGFSVSTAWISLLFLFLKKPPGCCKTIFYFHVSCCFHSLSVK